MLSAADELLQAVTDDGVRLALHRYRPFERQHRYPVLCCHGLAANRLTFDVHREMSLARHLRDQGYEVFVVELRGHGASQRPRWGWAFDDYLRRDLPAAVEAVRRLARAERVHWIGHSMGGLLAYAHLASGGEEDFASAVTVGSALDYSSGTGFTRLRPLRPLLGRVPLVPVGTVARFTSAFVGRAVTPYERFNVWETNAEARHWRRLCREGFHPVSSPVMGQLASALEPGGLTSRDGAQRYAEGLTGVRTPVLAMAGSRDAQCPPEAVRRTASVLERARVEVFGRDEGYRDHYGHFDLLIGRHCHRETFPAIGTWLDDHDR